MDTADRTGENRLISTYGYVMFDDHHVYEYIFDIIGNKVCASSRRQRCGAVATFFLDCDGHGTPTFGTFSLLPIKSIV